MGLTTLGRTYKDVCLYKHIDVVALVGAGLPVENFFILVVLRNYKPVLPVQNPVQNLLKTRANLLKTPVQNSVPGVLHRSFQQVRG